jgi:hypothetical protein
MIYTKQRNAYRSLVGKPEGKVLLGRVRPRSVGVIKMEFPRTRWKGTG